VTSRKERKRERDREKEKKVYLQECEMVRSKDNKVSESNGDDGGGKDAQWSWLYRGVVRERRAASKHAGKKKKPQTNNIIISAVGVDLVG